MEATDKRIGIFLIPDLFHAEQKIEFFIRFAILSTIVLLASARLLGFSMKL